MRSLVGVGLAEMITPSAQGKQDSARHKLVECSCIFLLRKSCTHECEILLDKVKNTVIHVLFFVSSSFPSSSLE